MGHRRHGRRRHERDTNNLAGEDEVRVFDLKGRSSEVFLKGLGRVRDIEIRDGYLHLLTNNTDGRGDPRQGDDKLLRVKLKE